MKILYLDPIVRTATSQNYKYYDGIFDELCKSNEVALCREVPIDLGQYTKYTNFEPDVVIFGLGWFEHKYYNKINNIHCPSFCILFKPQNDLEQKLSFCKINNISRILTPVPAYKKYENLTDVRSELFPYGFDPSVFFDRKNPSRVFDIGFSGALHESKHYPPGAFPNENIRTKIGEILSNKNDIYAFWSSSDSQPARIPDYEEYSKKINNSKIWIATQAAFGDITPRYYEVAACGTLLFCQKIPDEYRDIFIDGYNCVEFNHDLSDFEEKMYFYIKNDEEREKITKNAVEFFNNNFTWKRRSDTLVETIQEFINDNK